MLDDCPLEHNAIGQAAGDEVREVDGGVDAYGCEGGSRVYVSGELGFGKHFELEHPVNLERSDYQRRKCPVPPGGYL